MNNNDNLIKDLSTWVARQKALARPIGNEIYLVKTGWEQQIISNDTKVSTVETCMELEDAIQNMATQTIFIPKSASIATQHLNNIVERNPIKKTIFWENDTYKE